VRRAALRAMSHAARPDLRLLYERALSDTDACVRYYALRGLGADRRGSGRADGRPPSQRRRPPGAVRGSGRPDRSSSPLVPSARLRLGAPGPVRCHTPLPCCDPCRPSLATS
jgi:hypothetical protein